MIKVRQTNKINILNVKSDDIKNPAESYKFAEDIEKRINNYPKAIELLKSLGSTKDSEVGKFLKEIE
jgi:adenylate cyclase class IV